MVEWLRRHHWIHTWAEWVIVEGEVGYLFTHGSFPVTKQMRQCKVCGKKELSNL